MPDWICNPPRVFWVCPGFFFLFDMLRIPPQGSVRRASWWTLWRMRCWTTSTESFQCKGMKSSFWISKLLHDLNLSVSRPCSWPWSRVRTWSHWSMENSTFRLGSLFIVAVLYNGGITASTMSISHFILASLVTRP